MPDQFRKCLPTKTALASLMKQLDLQQLRLLAALPLAVAVAALLTFAAALEQ